MLYSQNASSDVNILNQVFEKCTATMDLSFEKQIGVSKVHQDLVYPAAVQAIADFQENIRTPNIGKRTQAISQLSFNTDL